MSENGSLYASERRARWVARLSLVAAFVCFCANCVGNRLLWTQGGAGFAPTLSQVISIATSLCVLAGVVLGVAGIVLGWRVKQSETIVLAVMGLLLNLGIIGVTVWVLWVLNANR